MFFFSCVFYYTEKAMEHDKMMMLTSHYSVQTFEN